MNMYDKKIIVGAQERRKKLCWFTFTTRL